jgi:hypothetical protein
MGSIYRAGVLFVVAVGVAIASLRSPSAQSFRWLPGLAVTDVSTDLSIDAIDRLEAIAEDAEQCPVVDAQEVGAEVAPSPGNELVLASMSTGVVVFDADGRRIASASLGECGGSADAIEAIAVGDAWIGTPVIAVVSSNGGHRESETRLSLFYVEDHALVTLFSEPIEVRDGVDLWTGSATLLPGAIVYRAPTGEVVLHALHRERAPLRSTRKTCAVRDRALG